MTINITLVFRTNIDLDLGIVSMSNQNGLCAAKGRHTEGIAAKPKEMQSAFFGSSQTVEA